MHVCLINSEYPKETAFGGIATYQSLLAHELIKKGHRVTVIAASFSKNQDYYEDGIHVIRIQKVFNCEKFSDFMEYRKKIAHYINELYFKDKIDIIETPEFAAESIFINKLNLNIPTVVKLHTSYKIWSHYNSVRHNDHIIHKNVIKYEDELLANADKIISCSELLKGMMKEYYPFLDTKKIDVVPNPIDINSFYPTKDNHLSKTILFCGSVEKRKGIFTLAQAIPIVMKELGDKDIKFKFIGNYENMDVNGISGRKEIYQIVPEEYHNNIEFLGVIPNNELNKYYNEACLGIVGSLFDNFPYVALEEMLTELPLIASDNTGVREMITNMKSGILYNPQDYKRLSEIIIELLKNPCKSRQMGVNARKEIIDKYNPDKIVEENIKIYERAIYEFNRNPKLTRKKI